MWQQTFPWSKSWIWVLAGEPSSEIFAFCLLSFKMKDGKNMKFIGLKFINKILCDDRWNLKSFLLWNKVFFFEIIFRKYYTRLFSAIAHNLALAILCRIPGSAELFRICLPRDICPACLDWLRTKFSIRNSFQTDGTPSLN